MKHFSHYPRLGSLRMLALFAPAWLCGSPIVSGQGTVFTYQGRLDENGTAANGSYDLTFKLFTAPSAGSQVGPTTTNSAAVNNGLFAVPVDFGANFPGADRWLEIAVRTNGGGAFMNLSARQKLTPTPYAITASNLSGTLPSVQLSGTLASAQLGGTYSGAVNFNNAGNSFTGNGSGLTSLNANNLSSGTVPTAVLGNAWKTLGNAGTVPGTHFVGTTDNQPLELRVNGQRAFRLQPNSGAAPTIIGGSNTVSATLVNGGVIAGGEMNLIESFSSHATVSGGFSNQILASSLNATIAGGRENQIQGGGHYSTIGGGWGNVLEPGAQQVVIAGGIENRMGRNANSSTIGGGWQNVIQSNTTLAVIAGGFTNSIEPFVSSSTIGGGQLNSIQTRADFSTIGGGRRNRIMPTNEHATIAGGAFNEIQSGALESFISGGVRHTIAANVQRAFIGGGNDHTIASHHGVIVGGAGNVIETNAVSANIGGGSGNRIGAGANYATIAGGLQNTNTGEYATIAGGRENVASAFASFAAGNMARALHRGSFVWADSLSTPFASTTNDQFLIRAAGGVGIGTSNPGYPLDVAGPVRITSVGDGAEVLQLGIERNWAFRQLGTGASTALELACLQINKNFIINTTGSVGIGTPTPGFTLHVIGTAGKPGGGTWSVASDERLKKNIRPLIGALEKLLALHGVNFEYIDPAKIREPSGERIGLVAQEVEKVFPDWVETGPDGYKRVTVRGLEALVVEALREMQLKQDARNENLAAQLKRMDDENTELKARLEKLERILNGRNGDAK